MIHPTAWVGWLAATIVVLSLTRNPLNLLLILACIVLVSLALRPHSKAPPLPVSPLRLGLFILIISALFNALIAHFGDTVLLTLPKSLPLVGGPITLEALAFGAINGLTLAGFLAAFSVLNMALPTHALIRLIPKAFHPVAIVVSIAVAFVPVTLARFQQIREAQAMRGHQLRGLRSWLPLFMPLFVSGLEQAMQLAEAMTARGFASRGAGHPEALAAGQSQLAVPVEAERPALAAGLLAVLTGLLLRLVWKLDAAGLALIALGSLLVLAALWLSGRRVRRTVYRPQPWTRRDSLLTAAAALTLAAHLLPLPLLDRAALFYYPYPRLTWPPFDAGLLLATLGLLAPIIWLRGNKT